MKTKTIYFWIILVLLTSCNSLRISNPGKARYTNHHGRTLARQGDQHTEIQEESTHEIRQNKTTRDRMDRKQPMDLGIFVFFLLLGVFFFGSITLFVLALKLGWATWAIIATGLLMTAVVVFVGFLVWAMILLSYW